MPDYDIEVHVLNTNTNAADDYDLVFYYDSVNVSYQLSSTVQIFGGPSGSVDKSCTARFKNDGAGNILVTVTRERSMRFVQIDPSILIIDA